jgi:hypothetical protein
MAPGSSSSLLLPSFLHGTYPVSQQKTRREGQRCGEQYRKDGTFPAPRELLEVPSGEVVLTQGVADFQHERPVWRLYMVSNVKSSLYEALDDQNSIALRDAYEEFFRETAWGSLYFAIEPSRPVTPERTAQRLQAVLRFWEPLQSVRYLYKTPGEALTLEQLLVLACDWAMDAWCPEEKAPVRARLEVAAERMAQAAREDCIEAILRQMPRVLSFARNLKHLDVVADPTFLRERFTTLDPRAFERVSAACTSDLLGQVYAWDRQLEKK